MSTEVRVPTLGESVTEATIGQWFKKVGDAVSADEPIVELETDKVTMEVPAPASGVVKHGAAEGDEVDVGAVVGEIDESAEKPAGSSSGASEEKAKAESGSESGSGADGEKRKKLAVE